MTTSSVSSSDMRAICVDVVDSKLDGMRNELKGMLEANFGFITTALLQCKETPISDFLEGETSTAPIIAGKPVVDLTDPTDRTDTTVATGTSVPPSRVRAAGRAAGKRKLVQPRKLVSSDDEA